MPVSYAASKHEIQVQNSYQRRKKFPPAQSTVRVRALVLLSCTRKYNPNPVRTLGKTKNSRKNMQVNLLIHSRLEFLGISPAFCPQNMILASAARN